jgi:hypothetical protein
VLVDVPACGSGYLPLWPFSTLQQHFAKQVQPQHLKININRVSTNNFDRGIQANLR